MVRFLVSVPAELHGILKEAARTYGQTLNGLIRQILWDWAERQGTTVGRGDEQEERRGG